MNPSPLDNENKIAWILKKKHKDRSTTLAFDSMATDTCDFIGQRAAGDSVAHEASEAWNMLVMQRIKASNAQIIHIKKTNPYLLSQYENHSTWISSSGGDMSRFCFRRFLLV